MVRLERIRRKQPGKVTGLLAIRVHLSCRVPPGAMLNDGKKSTYLYPVWYRRAGTYKGRAVEGCTALAETGPG